MYFVFIKNIWDYVLQNKMQYLKYISLYGNHVCFLIYEVMIPNVNLIILNILTEM